MQLSRRSRHLQGARGELTAEMRETMARMQEKMARMQPNVEFFLAHLMRPIAAYVPDTAALRTASSRIVVAVGEQSRGQFAHDTGLALADSESLQRAGDGGRDRHLVHKEYRS